MHKKLNFHYPTIHGIRFFYYYFFIAVTTISVTYIYTSLKKNRVLIDWLAETQQKRTPNTGDSVNRVLCTEKAMKNAFAVACVKVLQHGLRVSREACVCQEMVAEKLRINVLGRDEYY